MVPDNQSLNPLPCKLKQIRISLCQFGSPKHQKYSFGQKLYMFFLINSCIKFFHGEQYAVYYFSHTIILRPTVDKGLYLQVINFRPKKKGVTIYFRLSVKGVSSLSSLEHLPVHLKFYVRIQMFSSDIEVVEPQLRSLEKFSVAVMIRILNFPSMLCQDIKFQIPYR